MALLHLRAHSKHTSYGVPADPSGSGGCWLRASPSASSTASPPSSSAANPARPSPAAPSTWAELRHRWKRSGLNKYRYADGVSDLLLQEQEVLRVAHQEGELGLRLAHPLDEIYNGFLVRNQHLCREGEVSAAQISPAQQRRRVDRSTAPCAKHSQSRNRPRLATQEDSCRTSTCSGKKEEAELSAILDELSPA